MVLRGRGREVRQENGSCLDSPLTNPPLVDAAAAPRSIVAVATDNRTGATASPTDDGGHVNAGTSGRGHDLVNRRTGRHG